MASLKELKNKVSVIESTKKVTSAMKLVAGVKLRRAKQKAIASRMYASELDNMLSKINMELLDIEVDLFSGRKNVETVLLLVFGSDIGLCGNFNYLVNKNAKKTVSTIYEEGKKVKILCVGNKLLNSLKSTLKDGDTIELVEKFYNSKNILEKSKELSEKIIFYYRSGLVDKVSVVYAAYRSAMRVDVEMKNIIPIVCNPNEDKTIAIFEPSADKILNDLLPHNIAIQIYQCALESIASEQNARMTSMDSATRNADTLLADFKTRYNRGRQLKITQELTEIIAGAKAVEG